MKDENTANGLVGYIKKTLEESAKTRREYSLYGTSYVYVQDFLPDNVNVVDVLQTIEDIVPGHMVKEVDTIFIGDYQHLKDKAVTAMYDSGAIYISNEQKSNDDMVDDLVHEIAHSLEQPYGYAIYSDGVVEKEFLGKRMKMYELLSAYNFVSQNSKSAFMQVEYDHYFDELLYKKIGYERLAQLLVGVYTTPYAATSLREYFATGFEDYFLHDGEYLKKISPRLFNKIDKLVKGVYDG
tara:strand:+ start:443 stop:1159 length:717 start_codon:yes stop_codon:yes gene_type:complete